MTSVSMRGYQLTGYANRWQHWSQICFATLMKNPEIANNSTTTEDREEISTYLKSLEF
jgi:hypothetical protein